MKHSGLGERLQRRRWLSGVVFAVVPVCLFYLMEFYDRNPFTEIRAIPQALNILLFEALAWLLLFIFGSGRVALRILVVLAMGFGLTNHYVMKFRSTPFVPWDLFSVKTAASVADNYDFTPDVRVVVVTVLFVLVFAGLHFLKWKWGYPFVARGGMVILMVLLLTGFAGRLWDEGFQTKCNLYPFLFTPAYMTKVNGTAVTFVMNLRYAYVEQPEGYDPGEAAALLESYETQEEVETSELPNIIVIMDEAFSDLAVLGPLETSEDYMPFVHSLMKGAEDTVSGYLHVSVCGGNTANTEYEFLTGNSMAFYPVGSVPYQQYVKRLTPSLARYLKSLGYATVAIHPYNASGWSRNTVYPRLGFDTFLSLKNFYQPQKLRKYVTDETDFRKVIATYEKQVKSGDGPVFIFNVTMQNHGGYTEVFEDFQPDIVAEGIKSRALSTYLSLMKRTDEAVEELISYFENRKDKTIVVFFGDHQPNDTVARYIQTEDTKPEDRYKVPYFIWANYDIEETTGRDTSANYLASHVLDAAQIPKDAYRNFLSEFENYYPIYTAVYREALAEDASKLLEYQKLQYYTLFDWEETP